MLSDSGPFARSFEAPFTCGLWSLTRWGGWGEVGNERWGFREVNHLATGLHLAGWAGPRARPIGIGRGRGRYPSHPLIRRHGDGHLGVSQRAGCCLHGRGGALLGAGVPVRAAAPAPGGCRAHQGSFGTFFSLPKF